MRPIKVVLVSTAKDWHGGEQQALLLAQGLRQHGHDCRIVARRGDVVLLFYAYSKIIRIYIFASGVNVGTEIEMPRWFVFHLKCPPR